MKCKRCGKEIEVAGHCDSCTWEEVKERRSINWRGMTDREVIILDVKIEQKYADAGRVAKEE